MLSIRASSRRSESLGASLAALFLNTAKSCLLVNTASTVCDSLCTLYVQTQQRSASSTAHTRPGETIAPSTTSRQAPRRGQVQLQVHTTAASEQGRGPLLQRTAEHASPHNRLSQSQPHLQPHLSLLRQPLALSHVHNGCPTLIAIPSPPLITTTRDVQLSVPLLSHGDGATVA